MVKTGRSIIHTIWTRRSMTTTAIHMIMDLGKWRKMTATSGGGNSVYGIWCRRNKVLGVSGFDSCFRCFPFSPKKFASHEAMNQWKKELIARLAREITNHG